jgi:hypothetical protein
MERSFSAVNSLNGALPLQPPRSMPMTIAKRKASYTRDHRSGE